MLLIDCPYCGERDESEFSYGGRCIVYPPLDSSTTRGDWHRAIHLHDGSQNVINEYWYHEFGCEQWIGIKRDIESHEITSTSTAGALTAQEDS